jgi:hypothetical protein
VPDSRVTYVETRLRNVAERTLAREKAVLRPDAWRRLESLIETAVNRLDADNRLEDDDAVALASDRLQGLLTRASKAKRRAGRGGPAVGPWTGKRPKPEPAPRVVLTDAKINLALRRLCPGFWPFC